MKKIFLLLFLVLLLVACGDDKKSDSQEAPPENTTEARPTQQLLPIQPGIRTVSTDNLEVVHVNSFVSEGGNGWIALEVKNNNDYHLNNYTITLTLLDENQLELQTLAYNTPFAKIPAGYSLPIGIPFTVPEDYADFVALVEVDRNFNPATQALTGVFDLPTTLNPLENRQIPLTVSGTLTNNQSQDIVTPVVVVALYDTEGKIIHVAGAVLENSGVLPAGESTPFTATFAYLPTLDFEEIRVVSAGYLFESE